MSSICPFYKRGACRFGNRCRNSHDLASSSVVNIGREQNAVQIFNNSAAESQQRNRGFDSTRNFSLKIKSGTSTDTNLSSEETISCNHELMISELCKRLSKADMEIIALKKELRDKCNRGNLPCTEHNNFQLDDDFLHCTICFEIFIKPTVLSCSHTFCQWCIDTWSSVNRECPICRKYVVYKSYCLDLDNYIKKIIEMGPTAIRNSYKLLEEKRNLEGPKNVGPCIHDADDWRNLVNELHGDDQVNPFLGYQSI